MPQDDRHKEREIPIEFDFYNTLESLPVDNRCTIIMISCGSTTVKINEHIQTVTAPAVLCISQYDNFQCLERTHLSAKVFHFDPWYIKACLNFENLDDSVPIDNYYLIPILRSMILPINVVLSMVPTSTGNLQNTLGFHHRNFGKIPQDIVCLRAIKLKNYSCKLYLFIWQ